MTILKNITDTHEDAFNHDEKIKVCSKNSVYQIRKQVITYLKILWTKLKVFLFLSYCLLYIYAYT